MKKTYVAGSLMLVMALMMAGCGGGDKKPDAPKKDAPKAAAATDTVMLYSSMQEDQLNAVKKAFEKKYPNIKMDYYFAGTGKVKTKIFTEAKGGQVAADVIWVGDPADYIGFKADGKILQKYESPEAKNIDKAFIDPEGFYTGARMMNMGIAYNTTKVKKEEARSSQDLERFAGSEMERPDRYDRPWHSRHHQIRGWRIDGQQGLRSCFL